MEFRWHMKPQAVAHHDATITGQFIRLHPEIDAKKLEKFMKDEVKKIVQFC